MWLQQTSVRERRTLFAGFLGLSCGMLLALAISRTTVAAYALVIAAAWALPETCGRALIADPA